MHKNPWYKLDVKNMTSAERSGHFKLIQWLHDVKGLEYTPGALQLLRRSGIKISLKQLNKEHQEKQKLQSSKERSCIIM